MMIAMGALLISLGMGSPVVHAVATKSRARTLSLFTIGKSQNKNQVQYAVRVDESCVPLPSAPVFAYWRMLELGPNRVEPLLPRELAAYGLATQVITTHDDDGGKIHLVLRALSERPIVVETRRVADGTCRAVATATIAGLPAHLFDVYVRLTWHLSVDYLLLRGWSIDGARVLSEKLSR